jgi:SecD/SecF fusion protein
MYARRAARIRAENGGVMPAYATGAAATQVEVKPKASRRRITTPDDPSQGVSASEFKQLVEELHVDTPPARSTAAELDPTADATPEDLVMKDQKAKPKKPGKPRNRNHGRPR